MSQVNKLVGLISFNIVVMKRSELYKKLLEQIATKLTEEGIITPEEAITELDKIDFNNTLVTERDWFQDFDCGRYQKIVDDIIQLDSDSDIDVPEYDFCTISEPPEYDKSEVRSFFVNDVASKFAMITGKCIYDYCNDKLDTSDGILPIISLVWIKIFGNNTAMNEFWSLCNERTDSFYVLYKERIDENCLWDAYGYAYLNHLNNSSFPVPESLVFEKDTPFCKNLQFDKANKYEQYFGVFHVLEESKYCSDKLSRFINIYRVIEDLCYRLLLSNISQNSSLKNGFIRTSIRILSKASINEEDTIIKGIKVLFPQLDTVITSADISKYDNHLNDNYSISPGEQHSVRKIAKIIYKLRNSIVHNKHTELHFSFGNVSDYAVLIPLVELLTQKIEEQVVTLINDSSKNQVEYSNRTINIY
jgi:hypothetical protein